MRVGILILRSLYLAEFAAFVLGMPALARIAGHSLAGLAYLLILGVFAGLAAWSLASGKPSARVWAWGAAFTNLPVFPVLTPVGVLIAALLVALDRGLAPTAWASRTSRGSPVELPPLNAAIIPLGIAMCWAGGWSVHRYAEVAALPQLGALTLLAALWLLVPACAAIHQAGHWAGSLRAGIEALPDWSGWLDFQAAANDRTGLRESMFRALLGGPLASLASGAAFLTLFLSAPGTRWAPAAEALGLAAVVSLTIAALSILPWRFAGYRSDGASLLGLVAGAGEANRDVCLSLLAGMWMNGARPRDWDPRWLRSAAASPDLSRAHATACALNYLHAKDCGYDASARYWIGRIASEYAEDREAVPARWQLEIAYFLARHDQSFRAGEALAWRLAAGRCSGVPRYVTLRADAALAWARGDAEAAARLSATAEADAHTCRRTGIVDLEYDLLAEFAPPEAVAESADATAPAVTATGPRLVPPCTAPSAAPQALSSSV